MKRVKLGLNGPEVSEICLGTMTYGNQTGQDDAFAQMDRALDAGISFWDAAEIYPVNPVRKETCGRTEEIIGNWLAARGGRDRVQIATKVAGPGSALRDEGFSPEIMQQAVEGSLRRLQTDVIDLYQMHWPMRGHYHFRQMWDYDASGQDRAATVQHIDDMLGMMQNLADQGKVRAFGLSNDTAWGVTQWVTRAEGRGPRIVSVQNEYSLTYRSHDTDMAEACVNENITLLAYSPLAAGLLTGKYAFDTVPDGSRVAVDLATGGKGNLGGRKTDRAATAVEAYRALACEYGLSLIQMALAFIRQRPFPVISILGATSDTQLAEQLAGLDTVLPDDLLDRINQTYRSHPFPY